MSYLFHDNRNRRWICFLVVTLNLFICLGLHTSAAAYVLDAPHILDLMIKHLGSAVRLSVSQHLVITNRSAEQDATRFNETARYLFPDHFRSDTVSDSIQRVHVCSQGTALTVMDGKIASEPESAFDLYKDLLLYRSRVLLENRLIRLGVDLATSSLGRFQNKIVYVIGAVYPDDTRSQVWVDKESFRPLRWVLSEPGSDVRSTEFRYDMWRQIGSVHYPMLIQIFQDGVLLREIRADTLDNDPSFDTDIFNIDLLKSRYDLGPSESGKVDEMGEVQKTIQEFKRRFE